MTAAPKVKQIIACTAAKEYLFALASNMIYILVAACDPTLLATKTKRNKIQRNRNIIG